MAITSLKNTSLNFGYNIVKTITSFDLCGINLSGQERARLGNFKQENTVGKH